MNSFKILITVLAVAIFTLSAQADDRVVPFYQSLAPEDQKHFDLLTASTYLYPQAFSNSSGEIKSVQLRVCVEWTDPVQAVFDDRYYNDDNQPYRQKPPYRVSQFPYRAYKRYARPSVCKKFETVTIPTSQMVLDAAKGIAASGDRGTYVSLSQVDEDLDRRIKYLTTDKALQNMRREMEAKIKKEILEGPFVQELTQKIYEEIKAEMQEEQMGNRGLQ